MEMLAPILCIYLASHLKFVNTKLKSLLNLLIIYPIFITVSVSEFINKPINRSNPISNNYELYTIIIFI